MAEMNSDISVAHLLARLALGLNIAMHGLTRIPRFGDFEGYLTKEFTGSPLPLELVRISAAGIVAAESIIGVLLLLGLFQRIALVAGGLLMLGLLFGVCLIWNWNAAGAQMVYVVFFTGLLATLKFDRWSVDAWRKRKG
jgi:thiosulfate dehydrogenase [quinone] large subunit